MEVRKFDTAEKAKEALEYGDPTVSGSDGTVLSSHHGSHVDGTTYYFYNEYAWFANQPNGDNHVTIDGCPGFYMLWMKCGGMWCGASAIFEVEASVTHEVKGAVKWMERDECNNGHPNSFGA